MIVDIERFLAEGEPFWDELEDALTRLERDPAYRLDLAAGRRLYYLYHRAAADLCRLRASASEPDLRRHLEALVGRAYGEVHETRRQAHRLAPIRWALRVFPSTFRRHVWAFWVAVAATIAGCLLGGASILVDPDAKAVLLPYHHLRVDPSARVEDEERVRDVDPREGRKASGTSFYFTHNTRVAITTMALGISWGVGTLIILFVNGVMLGAVVVDYAQAGETVFLVGWLLPHGAIEIPAILLAGQAGLVLGRALIGWGSRLGVRERLRVVAPDIVTLVGGVALMLAWAGFVEAFLSQYHEPVIPYWVKIGFGAVELILLTLFLSRSGRTGTEEDADA